MTVAVTVDALAAFLGTTAAQLADGSADVCSAAAAMVTATVGDREADIPPEILTQAAVMTAAEMWRRRDAPGGVVNAWGDTQVPIRLALDPLKPARPLLAPWLPPGIA